MQELVSTLWGDNMSRDIMRELAEHIQRKIGKDYGFALLIYDFGDSGRMNYVSNSQREDVVTAMKEFIDKTEEGYGTHQI